MKPTTGGPSLDQIIALAIKWRDLRLKKENQMKLTYCDLCGARGPDGPLMALWNIEITRDSKTIETHDVCGGCVRKLKQIITNKEFATPVDPE